VNSTKNIGRTNAAGDARKSLVDKSHEPVDRFVITVRANGLRVLTRKLRHIRGSLRLGSELEITVERMPTDCLLRAAVHKGLDRMPIYLNWDAAIDK
jgi:hypothetical protein